VLRRKRLGLEINSIQTHLKSKDGGPPLEKLARELADLDKQITKVVLDAPSQSGQGSSESWRSPVITQGLAAGRDGSPYSSCTVEASRNVTRERIASALPENSVLLEFMCGRILDFNDLQSDGATHYLAFLMQSSDPNDVSLFDLGRPLISTR